MHVYLMLHVYDLCFPSQLSFEELRRGKLRRELLTQIQLAGRTSGLKFVQALRTAVDAIHTVSSDMSTALRLPASLIFLIVAMMKNY